MTIRKFRIERFSVTSSKAIVAALKAAVGQPDMVELASATKRARALTELESSVHRGFDRTGLMMFMELDHGAILRKETRLDTPKIVHFLIGNPFIMKEMAKHRWSRIRSSYRSSKDARWWCRSCCEYAFAQILNR